MMSSLLCSANYHIDFTDPYRSEIPFSLISLDQFHIWTYCFLEDAPAIRAVVLILNMLYVVQVGSRLVVTYRITILIYLK